MAEERSSDQILDQIIFAIKLRSCYPRVAAVITWSDSKWSVLLFSIMERSQLSIVRTKRLGLCNFSIRTKNSSEKRVGEN